MSAQLSRITSLGASNEVRIIAYGLYGGDARYTVGVLRNAQLAPLVYPGWKVRVYLDGSVPAPVVGELERLGAQLVRADDPAMGGGIGGMFWRFLVAADEQVDRFIACGLAYTHRTHPPHTLHTLHTLHLLHRPCTQPTHPTTPTHPAHPAHPPCAFHARSTHPRRWTASSCATRTAGSMRASGSL